MALTNRERKILSELEYDLRHPTRPTRRQVLSAMAHAAARHWRILLATTAMLTLLASIASRATLTTRVPLIVFGSATFVWLCRVLWCEATNHLAGD